VTASLWTVCSTLQDAPYLGGRTRSLIVRSGYPGRADWRRKDAPHVHARAVARPPHGRAVP